MNSDFCYKGAEKKEVKFPPIKLAIATIALKEHVSQLWLDRMQDIYKELEAITD